MQIFPLIKIKNREILNSNYEELLEKLSENDILYIYDLDGITKDKPNLCTFQRLSKTHELWVDSGPRNLGDVVDSLMSGVVAVTLRKNLWKNIDLEKIREITENNIYANIDPDGKQNLSDFFYTDVDGLVNFISKEEIDSDEDYYNILKQLLQKNKNYTYERNIHNLNYWKTKGIENILVDIEKYEEFKKHGL